MITKQEWWQATKEEYFLDGQPFPFWSWAYKENDNAFDKGMNYWQAWGEETAIKIQNWISEMEEKWGDD